jgi:hypothetical protein
MRRLRTRLVLLLLALVAIGLTAPPANATHLRGGDIAFRPVLGSPNTIEFSYGFAVRRDVYGGTPVVGSFVHTTDVTLCFGDSLCTAPLWLTVLVVDPVNNWMYGALGEGPGQTTIVHTYASPGAYLAYSLAFDRLGVAFPNAHINNPNEPFRLEALVPVGSGDTSPRSTLPPLIQCPHGTVNDCTFQFPAFNPGGEVTTYRLATALEAGGSFTQPPGATITPTGLFHWNTASAMLGPPGYNTLYSAQVVIEERNLSNVVFARVAVDFLIQLVPGPGPPATLLLSPETDTNTVGQQHCVTALVRDVAGAPVPNVVVRFSVSGANTASGSATTSSGGTAMFCYTGTVAGTDTIHAYADSNGDNVQNVGEPFNEATKIYIAAAPATLTLSPKAYTNPVDSQHCVTATVKDAFGNPVSGVTVRFSVAGSSGTPSGSMKTNAAGTATFCYTGPALPGADKIHAYADTNGDNVQNPTEPFDDAAKAWILPVSTPGCEVKITNGGWIIAANGDQASFGGNAQVDAGGNVSGNEEYQDRGPATPFNLHGNVLVVVCGLDGKSATIFGKATIDGTGDHYYRIEVKDLAEPGKDIDTYRMRVNLYDSGEQKLQAGNVQVHKS